MKTSRFILWTSGLIPLGAIALSACSADSAFPEEEFLRARLACERYFECYDAVAPTSTRSEALWLGYRNVDKVYGVDGAQWTRPDRNHVFAYLRSECDGWREQISGVFASTGACAPSAADAAPSDEWQSVPAVVVADPHEDFSYVGWACEKYIECMGEVLPAGAATAAAGFGGGSTCWDSYELATTCNGQCRTLWSQLNETYPGACPMFLTDAEICADRPGEACFDCCEAFGAGGSDSDATSCVCHFQTY